MTAKEACELSKSVKFAKDNIEIDILFNNIIHKIKDRCEQGEFEVNYMIDVAPHILEVVKLRLTNLGYICGIINSTYEDTLYLVIKWEK